MSNSKYKNRFLSARLLLWSAPIFLGSCSGMESQNHLSYHPVVNLTPGLQYHYTIAQRNHTTSTERGVKVSRTNNVFLSMNVQSNPNGLHLVYDTLAVHQQSGNRELNLDSGGEDMLNAFSGAGMDARLDDQGRITSLSGLEGIYQKMGIGSDIFHWQSQFDETWFTHLFDKSWNIFPVWGVRVGDSWRQEDSLNADLHVPVQTAFTLVKVENGVMHIKTEADVDIRNRVIEKSGNNQLSLRGKQIGFLDVDAATGNIIDGSSSLKAEGAFTIGKTIIPMVVDSTYSVTASRI